MQRPFLQTISPLSPNHMRSTFFRQTRSKMLERKQDSFNSRKKQVKSLLSIYADKLRQTSSNHQNQSKDARKKESLTLNSKDTELMLYAIQNKNNKNQRVQSTIDSVNNYTQQLKMTLINQYKSRKQKELLKQKTKIQKQKPEKSKNERLEDNPEVLNSNNPMLTKYANKALAFKTINLLYRAIIDNSFHKRKKEEFELHANKLPIINRSEITKKRQLQLHDEQQQKAKVQNHKTLVAIHRSHNQKQKKEVKTQRRLERDDLDIIPWKSEDAQVEQN